MLLARPFGGGWGLGHELTQEDGSSSMKVEGGGKRKRPLEPVTAPVNQFPKTLAQLDTSLAILTARKEKKVSSWALELTGINSHDGSGVWWCTSCEPSLWEAEAGKVWKCEASLGYRVRSGERERKKEGKTDNPGLVGGLSL